MADRLLLPAADVLPVLSAFSDAVGALERFMRFLVAAAEQSPAPAAELEAPAAEAPTHEPPALDAELPPAPTPYPPAFPPQRLRADSPWTPERVRIVQTQWPTDLPRREVLANLQALPGPAIDSIHALNQKARKMGLRHRAPVQPAARAPAPTPQPPPAPPLDPAAAEAERVQAPRVNVTSTPMVQVLAWARGAGLTVPTIALPADTYRLVNAARVEQGLPPFRMPVATATADADQ